MIMPEVLEYSAENGKIGMKSRDKIRPEVFSARIAEENLEKMRINVARLEGALCLANEQLAELRRHYVPMEWKMEKPEEVWAAGGSHTKYSINLTEGQFVLMREPRGYPVWETAGSFNSMEQAMQAADAHNMSFIGS